MRERERMGGGLVLFFTPIQPIMTVISGRVRERETEEKREWYQEREKEGRQESGVSRKNRRERREEKRERERERERVFVKATEKRQCFNQKIVERVETICL